MNRYLSPVLSTAFVALLLTAGLVLFSFKDQAWAVAQTEPAAQLADTLDSLKTITVQGSGIASAPADMAHVLLTVGGGDGYYGPSGPEFKPTDEDDLALTVRVLEESGVAADTIAVDAFSPGEFGPSSTVSNVSFLYPEPSNLSRFLADFLEALNDEKGPKISGAKVVFLVEDCAALEASAMVAALDNARQRAATMATEMDGALNDLISMEEGRGDTFYGTSSAQNCASLEAAIHHRGFGFAGGGENSADKVDVSIMLNATFAVE